MMESPPSNLLWGHFQNPPFLFHFPSFCSLLLSPISTPLWSQFSLIGPCSSPSPPLSSGGTS